MLEGSAVCVCVYVFLPSTVLAVQCSALAARPQSAPNRPNGPVGFALPNALGPESAQALSCM